MRLIITTQVRENYGAHSWDGEGECPQYWKFKGGNDYELPIEASDIDRLQEIVALHRDQCESSDEYFEEWIISWEVLSDNELTEYERDQMEFDGKIEFVLQRLFEDRRSSLFNLI